MGSIEKGKLADFFLIPGDPIKNLKAIKTISMVVKDGTVYYPSEVYPKFGIQPFAPAPKTRRGRRRGLKPFSSGFRRCTRCGAPCIMPA